MRTLIGVILVCLLCCGCGREEETDKVKELEYQMVREEEIPSQLLSIIQEKKKQSFKLTYEEEEWLYIAVGYGEQACGGYSIQVKELYLGEQAVYFHTELIGPKKNDVESREKSYPYMVVLVKKCEKPVVFR